VLNKAIFEARPIFSRQRREGSVRHVNAVEKLPVVVMSLVVVAVALFVVTMTLVLSFAIDVHGVIGTLGESILLLSIVGDDSAEDGALVVLRDTSNDNTVSTWRLAVVDLAVLLDWELEVWLVSVAEGEFFVVVVSVRVYKSGQSGDIRSMLGIRAGYICLCLQRVSKNNQRSKMMFTNQGSSSDWQAGVLQHRQH